MAIITPKAGIIARSPQRIIRSSSALTGADIKSNLLTILRKVGWSINGSTAISKSQGNITLDNGVIYPRSISADLSVSGTNELNILVSDSSGYMHQDTSKPLKLSRANEYYVFANPYQFIIAVNGTALGPSTVILVSSLHIPAFALDSPFIQAIIACEATNLLSQFINTGLFVTYAGVIRKNVSVTEWTSQNASSTGAATIFGYNTDNVSLGPIGHFSLKSPAWLAWGNGSSAETATIKGFLWDCVNFFSSTIPLFREYETDGKKYFPIKRYLNNTFAFEFDFSR